MTKQVIGIGATANDGTGDPLRTAFDKINQNFTELYNGFQPTATPATASSTGTTGTVAWDANYIYVCVATNTWKRVAIATW